MSVFGFFKRGNRASEHVTQERLAACEVCPDRAGPVCGVCGCVLALKTKLLRESCPRDRWPDTPAS